MAAIQDDSIFTDSWWIYKQVLDADHMHHEGIYRDAASFIGDRFGGAGISVLDLGCGDARHLIGALGGQQVTCYLGVDLSPVSLSAAAENLPALRSTQTELIEADLLEAVDREGPGFDLVFSGFAIHHLQSEQKRQFFLKVAGRLEANGVLVILDVSREPGEDRATYLDHYCGWIMSSWTTLPVSSREAVCEHVRSSDFPEHPDTLSQMARAAGLSAAQEISVRRWHRCWWFERTSGM
jgi:cyclopropane fatty-acyl-phospholipid synthase-like methyltransferase